MYSRLSIPEDLKKKIKIGISNRDVKSMTLTCAAGQPDEMYFNITMKRRNLFRERVPCFSYGGEVWRVGFFLWRH